MPRPSEPLLGLSNGLLPIHLKPCHDELLSSWIIRIAHAHGLKLQTFSALIFGRDKGIWNRDIDKLAPDWLVVLLSDVTATPTERVIDTTLRSYEGFLYERHQPNGNTRWILPLGVYHRTHRNPGLLCCPACLAEDTSPYFRRSWRLAFSVACTKHKSWLIDRCPHCNSFIEPHRSDMQQKELFPLSNQLVYCWHCGHDLRCCHIEPVPSALLLRLQGRMDHALMHGHTDWAGNPSMYSLQYFDGSRALVAGLTSSRTINRLELAHDCNELTQVAWPRSGFEFANLGARKNLLVWLSMLLQDWPKNLRTLIHDSRLRYADLKGDSDSRPYWIEDVIKHEAGGGVAAISDDEVLSITHAVEKQHGRFSLEKARALSGRDLGNHVTKRSAVSDDVYEDLMTSIDHQIACTFDETERACLIRDKIMFAVGRQLQLSESSLAGLTLAQLYIIAPKVAKLDFSDVARTPAQARAWVEWYWNEMRPNLFPQPGCSHIFTSHLTQHQFSVSAISARFNKVVNAAMLRATLPTFGRLTNLN